MIDVLVSGLEHIPGGMRFDMHLNYEACTSEPGDDQRMAFIEGVMFKQGEIEGIDDLLPKIDVLREFGFIPRSFNLAETILNELSYYLAMKLAR